MWLCCSWTSKPTDIGESGDLRLTRALVILTSRANSILKIVDFKLLGSEGSRCTKCGAREAFLHWSHLSTMTQYVKQTAEFRTGITRRLWTQSAFKIRIMSMEVSWLIGSSFHVTLRSTLCLRYAKQLITEARDFDTLDIRKLLQRATHLR